MELGFFSHRLWFAKGNIPAVSKKSCSRGLLPDEDKKQCSAFLL